jgi:putative sigma-54 modulation protein
VRIAIRHRHIDVPEDLRAACEEKLQRVARHLNGMESADVAFIEERNPRIADKEVCEVTLHGHGHIVRAKAAAPEQLAALDKVVEKLQHRLERLKGRLNARSPARGRATVDSTPDRTSAHDAVDDADEGQARIVKTKQFAIKPMTPEEASLQMELLGHDFFLFTNAETDRAAVVYRRNDGYVGLIEST